MQQVLRASDRANHDVYSDWPMSRSAPRGEEKPVTIAPAVIAATWKDGLFVFSGDARRHVLAGRSVEALASDGRGGVLAIVDGHSLCRRTALGGWSTIATSESPLACCVAVGPTLYVGTGDAHVLRIGASGEIENLDAFATVAGRESWYAGSAVIDGQLVGPPLGVRSIAATAGGAILLANVHVGGIPRSTDGGATWHPTIDIESDVHEVRAHAARPEWVVAAAGAGLCISRDGGASWTVGQQGLHASYCSAVACGDNFVLVAASADHFAAHGAVYRRALDGDTEPVLLGGGFPRWTDGIVDTGCIAARGSTISIADKGGNLYVSMDAGRTWTQRADDLEGVSSVLVI
jgi:photosystem II stability/assembly factor-like uncharacterized protein